MDNASLAGRMRADLDGCVDLGNIQPIIGAVWLGPTIPGDKREILRQLDAEIAHLERLLHDGDGAPDATRTEWYGELARLKMYEQLCLRSRPQDSERDTSR